MIGPIVIASYRGPIKADAGPHGEIPKGTGGLIQALQPWARECGALWVFAAEEGSATLSNTDGTTDGQAPVAIDDMLRRGHYDVVSNSILWPLFHGLRGWGVTDILGLSDGETAWGNFRTVNLLFAERIAELAPTGATVVAHDYQLLLLPGMLRPLRPDLKIVYFHHIPFASVAEFAAIPEEWRQEVADSLVGCRCGFQSPRWESRYLDFCAAENRALAPDTFVAPVFPDLHGLQRAADSDEVARLRCELRDRVGQHKLVARVDRADPMKNILGGIRALDLLLSQHPRWRREVVFVHHLVPTRGSINYYKNHLDEVLEAIDAVNRKWRDDDWQPVHVNVADQREYGLALFSEYDVLLVNPVREGMNLVACEGPAVNARNGVVVLSKEAGAHDSLASAVIGIDPNSDSDTATALANALSMPASERVSQAETLRSTLASLGSGSWHDAVVRAGGQMCNTPDTGLKRIRQGEEAERPRRGPRSSDKDPTGA